MEVQFVASYFIHVSMYCTSITMSLYKRSDIVISDTCVEDKTCQMDTEHDPSHPL